MPDWSKSMQQTFEYYIVDPKTWKDKARLDTIISCKITWESDVDTLGSATIEATEVLDECYVRVYLITIQNGIRERHPLGTFMVQTPSTEFDGKVCTVAMDAYTPLIELKEKLPPYGYAVDKEMNIMSIAYKLVKENVRAPVAQAISDAVLDEHFVSEVEDTWVTFITDLIAKADYSLALDEMGRVIFTPYQDIASLQPVYTFNDDNSSILQASISTNHDLYGLPNVCEVIYSSSSRKYFAKAVNDDPNSLISTVNRGREIVYRETSPSIYGTPNQTYMDEYAERLLRSLSSVENTVTYTHAYCGVRLGDCIRLNYKRAGLSNIKGKIITQTIKCEPGCPVTEKAVFTKNLWDKISIQSEG